MKTSLLWVLSCALVVSLIIAANGSAAAAPTFTLGAPGEGVTTDLLDHSQGTRLAGSSRMHDQCSSCGVSNARSAIGFTSSSFIEPLHSTFRDGLSAGTVDSITYMLPSPITATSFDLRLTDDGASNFRMASAFSLEASTDGVNFTTISSAALPVYDGITISDAAPTIVADAQFFRLNVTRAGTGGVRLRELDLFGTTGGAPQYVVDPDILNATTNGAGDEPPGLSYNFARSSAVVSGTDTVEDAFGNNDGAVEPGTFIFDNNRTPDNDNGTIGDGGETVDYIEWKTTQPVTLAGLELLVSGDGEGSSNRGTELIRILVEGTEVDLYDNNRDGTGGAGNPLVRIFQGGPVTGDDFRIEVTHKTSPGARIQEINAVLFVEPSGVIPEPTAFLIWSLLAGLGMGLGWRRRK